MTLVARWSAALVLAAGLAATASGVSSAATRAATAAGCAPPPTTTQSQQNAGAGAINSSMLLRAQGTLRAIMLFVDFPDRPATQSTADVFASQFRRLRSGTRRFRMVP